MNFVRLGILGDIGSHTYQGGFGNDGLVPDRSVHPKEAVVFDRAYPRDYYVGRDKYVIFNDRVMTDVIATPQYTVVTNFDKGLDGIILEDKAVVSDI